MTDLQDKIHVEKKGPASPTLFVEKKELPQSSRSEDQY